jgi:hypothetical protein
MSVQAEEFADWCESDGDLSFCGTRMKEHSRQSFGVRWCFHCRKRHEFDKVVMVPDGLSYYGPDLYIEGLTNECTDLFPGWSRSWGDE